MLTNGRRTALDALCRAIIPAAFENPLTADLPEHVELRIAELTTYHRRRALLALRLFDSSLLSLLLIGRPVRFAHLTFNERERMLTRCALHRVAAVRLLFSSVRRLVLHTHYGRAAARSDIGHLGPLHARAVQYAWEGPLAGAGPVVAARWRNVVRERIVPAGVVERMQTSSDLRTRVCIIGSGVGGATAAAILAGRGHDVVVLEEGGYFTAADFGDDETRALQTLYAEHGLRSTDALNVSILQGRCAGGGSTVNWMVMLRTPDAVLEEWQREHGTEDMSPGAMKDEFARFEAEWNVGVVADDAHSPVNRLILDSAAKLGWRAQAGSVNARECMRTGACGLGCRYDAKQSALRTQLARALADGARLYCNTSVRSIARNAGAWRVHASNGDHAFVVTADVVILAAGAVGTPVLLQRSGLACDGVGGNLRLHPTTAVVGFYDEPFYAASGIPLSAYCDEFCDLDGGYGHWIEAPPLTAGLAAVALPGFGASHRQHMQRYPFLAPLIVLTRDGAPAGASQGRVSLRDDAARIAFEMGASDRASMLHGLESAARLHFAAGARQVMTLHAGETLLRDEAGLARIREANARFGDPALFSAHVNGTCRIGRSARHSGCRPDGAVHGHAGLYVMDGSLLPTAPGVNPHETIAGVTAVLARKLADSLPLSR